MFHVFVYVPSVDLDKVKKAMFDAGAGRLGQYEHCAWQVKGQGQFLPLEGSDPHIGQQGKVEIVEEYRLELIVEDVYLKRVIQAMKKAHPYETPAFGAIALHTIKD
jgi:hypothetical protein